MELSLEPGELQEETRVGYGIANCDVMSVAYMATVTLQNK